MTPLEFLSFRARLEAASGFQSDQFRQVDSCLAPRAKPRFARFPGRSRAREALTQRYHAPTLWDAFVTISRGGYRVPTRCLSRDVTAVRNASPNPEHPHRHLRGAMPRTAELLRTARRSGRGYSGVAYRHVKMVRTHDRHQARYRRLERRRLSRDHAGESRCFPDLWEIRSHL
jgi:tryptophan 2,3-dioxygenase